MCTGRIKAGLPRRDFRRLDGRVGGSVNGRCQNGFHSLGADTDTVGHHQFGLCSGFSGESGLDQAVKKGVGGETGGYGLTEVDEGIAVDRRWSGGEKLWTSRFLDPSGRGPFTGRRWRVGAWGADGKPHRV